MDYISEVFSNMSMGFQLMADPIILLYCFAGVVLGAFIGALPGLGPSCGIAILLPATYGMDPTSGIIMLCGIYYGAMYGGSITAILINVPGDAASVCTTLDGYQGARHVGVFFLHRRHHRNDYVHVSCAFHRQICADLRCV